MHIPDPIELGEASMERWADSNMRDDEFKCYSCGQWFPLDTAQMSSPDPYAPPCCINCIVGFGE
jgi:hypothetical protein